jgi:hypothetical protein
MEPDVSFTFEAELWLYSGNAAWHFITLPEETGGAARFFAGRKSGFGSIPVMATIGGTRWKTSIFPDRKSGSYLLPVKAEVRRREAISAGESVAVHLTINP